MANQLQPKYEMPPQAVAVFDMVVAFFLLFVPGSAVLLVHEGYGALCITFLAECELPDELGVDEPARNVNSPAEFLREGGSMP